ncbi:transglycosylase domain-containing protein [Nonomuraea insulae]|uniref:Transglycosylase domain-containing protein n=1 Tax=Nonomuraea insulae TaxID=1616787 RepID=A0ABW1CDF7_9ACTN
MPQGPAPQTGESGWGAAQPPPRRAEAAYEQTGAMAAQPHDESGPRRAEPRRSRAEHGQEPPPRSRARQDRQDTRTVGNQETMVSDAPRRSRRRGSGQPPEPPGPPTKKDGDGRGGWRRFVPSWKIVMVSAVVLTAGLFGMIMVAYANTPVPTTAQADATAQQSTIYYRDGKTVIAKLGFKRDNVGITEMAESVKDGAVAIENDTFYEDSGISISGMFRSAWMTATGQQLQGASTITQQMARGYYDGLSQEVSIKRKIMEIFVAVKLDETMSKEDILATYLNTVNFGRAYGVEAAAKAYFGKRATAAKLTPEQGAYLAARIQQPNWAPDDPGLKYRFNQVIKNMAEMWPQKYGQLPQTAKFPKTLKKVEDDSMSGLNGYMVEEVLKELETRGLTREAVKSGGYDIVSTFDKKLMKAAQVAVKSTMQANNLSTEYHGGLAAVDPKNGRVLAFYGGDDAVTDPWNEPFQSTKQAASAFKPYVLAAWLQAGYSLKSFVPGNQTVPKELPGQQQGGFGNSHNVGAAVDVVKATAQSVNTAYVSMAFALPNKLDDVKNLTEAAGFNQQRMEDDVKVHHYQFAIGSALVTPVEQAAGYSIFANGGKYTRYHVVRQVKQNGEVAFGEQTTSKSVIDAGVAADATIAMQEVLKTGTAAGKGLGTRPAAGKTGTNNDEKEAWFVGYTPQISTAVGFYREQCVTKTGKTVAPKHSNCPWARGTSKKYTPQKPYTTSKEVSLGFEGAGPPTIAWQKFMQLAHEGLPVEQFPDRADVGSAENIVPSPAPKPTPTPSADDNPFDADNPFDDGSGNEDCLIDCDNDNGSVPDGEPNIDDGGGVPDTGGDVGLAGPGSVPEPRSSGSRPMSTRPEDQ